MSMKNLNLILCMAVAIIFSVNANAQDAKNPWGISVGAHAVDHTSVRGVFDGFFDHDDYSITSPLSKLSVIRHLSGRFSADLTASVGKIENKRMNIDDQLFINAGLGLRARLLGSESNSYWFDPYLRIGAAYHQYDYSGIEISEDNPYMVAQRTGMNDNNPKGDYIKGDFTGQESYFMAQAGLGINFWFTKNFGLNFASDFNMAPSEEVDYVNFFQHTAGISFKFGDTDRDNDGIPDDEDECPDIPGLAEFNGCPDTDGDGIPDHLDSCPNEFGPKENNGCPWGDTDGDGITDNVDRCPNEFGPKENNGCPWGDADGDGVTDNLDNCPNTPSGVKVDSNGCPIDTDGDGFPDYQDKCPNEHGVSPDGCPKAETVVKNINVGFVVEYETNSATITPASLDMVKTKANEIKRAFEIYPNMTLYIDGHTDSKGAASYNKKLSQKRAASVVKALEANGVSEGALTPRGLGEDVPKCTNDTEEGRQCNRRVEVTIKSTGA